MTLKTKLHLAKPEHEVCYQELCALVSKHAHALTAAEILAVAANMIGKLVALQDQRTTTPQMAMKLIAENIEYGNRTVLKSLEKETKGRA